VTPELYYLVWSAALTLVPAVIAVGGAQLQVGLPRLAGNRENMPEFTGWADRAQRAHRNMLKGLVLFATWRPPPGCGREQRHHHLCGRVAHAAIYLAGIPWARTAAWGVSVVGLFLIFWQLVA
jgi:uncharacterized MAPEG superfamily protein